MTKYGEDGRVAESTQNDFKGHSDGEKAGGFYGLVFGLMKVTLKETTCRCSSVTKTVLFEASLVI